MQWVTDHWVIIVAVLSELLAFVPAKWNGILQSIIKIGAIIFTKKEDTQKK
jgi:hypothetical protein